MKKGLIAVTLLLSLSLTNRCQQVEAPDKKVETIEEKAARGRAMMAQKKVEAAISEIASLPKSAKVGAVAELCDRIPAEAQAGRVKARCAEAHLEMARTWFKSGYLDEGKAALDRARSEGAEETKLSKVTAMIPAATAKAEKLQKETHAAAARILRKAFAKQLRQQYLDGNLDIKVETAGKNSERIILKFVLFNDVWANKLKNNTELFDQLRKLEFTRLELTDGYDYDVYWNLK